jgi:exonuclease III
VAWLIQETHISSQEEAEDMQRQWARLWGKRNDREGEALSHWSTTGNKTGGVAILLPLLEAQTAQPWQRNRWSNRVISVSAGEVLLMNVYAPNDRVERETFFAGLASWPSLSRSLILAGDFNSVQSPTLDRMGGQRSGIAESTELARLVQRWQLEDARTLEEEADSDAGTPPPTQFYTCWGPDSASRIDRFYVPQTWTAEVQRVVVTEPDGASDHQRVCFHWRDIGTGKEAGRRHRRLQYPIRSAHPEQTIQELVDELIDEGVVREVTAATWDTALGNSVQCVKRGAWNLKQRREAYKHRVNEQHRAHLLTRRELLRENEADLREEMLIRVGQKLERPTDQLRWDFKRVSNWEKDQTVAVIRCINGAPFSREMTIATKFSSKWKPILGVVHSTVADEHLESKFDEFVTIPPARRISDQQNLDLMREITEDEVIQAVVSLKRHKAAGEDELNNDFYKDTQAVFVPALVKIGNELLQGGNPPPSFLKALIIPLRKKGDSVDAMNFRPISLLQTAYKVYMKVIATRTQTVMGTPIGDSQQGFVHDRQMLKTVMMMLAVLATANDEPELAAALSHVILLLDFRKAYDTVAREFLFLALLKFGFSEAFVNMLRRLHDGTTARFLVNGELSEEIDVKTGIRQGCPLAPLLFILAAEVVALAIQQDSQVRGIEIPGGGGERHEFSAFVDDSTVFLDQAQQVPRVMQIVANFGKISGLQVQPTKSHLIFLNTAVNVEEYEGIPALAHGDTVWYLGYAVGTGTLMNVNWAERIRGIQRRLATATQVATSIENRVTLLNVIMLPSVLFTAAVFDMPNWAVKQLVNMQKQFLWQHATGTEPSRHKINPGLVHAPKAAGGVGLASIPLACKTQRVKHAMIWLIQKKDRYFAAWRAWMFRGAHQEIHAGLTPRQTIARQPNRRSQTSGTQLMQLLGEWIQPRRSSTGEQIEQYGRI